MKSVFFLTFLLLLNCSFSLKLQVGQQITLQQAYELACIEAQGQVQYQADNLPAGVRLDGNRITVYDHSKVSSGYYPIRVIAQDGAGQLDQQIVVIFIDGKSSENLGGIAAISTGSQQSATSQPQTSQPQTQQSSVYQPAPLPQPDSRVGPLLDSLLTSSSGSSAVPSGSSPSTSSPSSSLPTSSSSSFPSTVQTPQPTSYPQGSSSQIPNFTPTIISTQNSTPTSSNRNTITVDDVAEKVIFERQLNAAKAIANLLAIVKQATANKNAAEQEVQDRERLYNSTLQNQRLALSNQTQSQNNIARINLGISTLQSQISSLTSQLNGLSDTQKGYQGDKNTWTQQVQNKQSSLNQVNNNFSEKSRELSNSNEELEQKKSDCSGYNGNISSAEYDRENKISQASQVANDLTNSKNAVLNAAERVNSLRSQLAEAEAALSNAQNQQAQLQNEQNQLGNDILALNNKIIDLQNKQTRCQPDIASLSDRVNQLKQQISPLSSQKQNLQNEISSLTSKITNASSQIGSLPQKNKDLTEQISKAKSDLAYLNTQLPIFQRLLNDAAYANTVANDQVRNAKANLDSAAKRFQDEQNNIISSTKNLELARIEKQAADDAVNNLLQQSANILPYQAAPSGTGLNSTNSNGIYSIGNWNNFVQNAYGNTVNPLFNGNLDTLYSVVLPINQSVENLGSPSSGSEVTLTPSSPSSSINLGGTQGNLVSGITVPGVSTTSQAPTSTSTSTSTSTFTSTSTSTSTSAQSQNCSTRTATPQRALSGFVISSANGSFKVFTNTGSSYDISYSPCTLALASQPNYSIKVGDIVVLKGLPNNDGVIQATQCSFVKN